MRLTQAWTASHKVNTCSSSEINNCGVACGVQCPRSMKYRGNWRAVSGVYTTMIRGLVGLLCLGTVLAQTRPPDPIFAKREAVGNARREGRFTDAAALREEARTMLQKLPVDAPQFNGWVQTVMQLYQEGGRTAQARAVVEEALGRVGAGNPNRASLLQTMGQLWQQDGNLLKAAAYVEQAVAAAEADAATPAVATPAAVAPNTRAVFMTGNGVSFYSRAQRAGTFGVDLGNLYQQLAEVDRQLGRRDAVETIVGKMRTLAAKQGDARFAWFFERYGDSGEAAAMLRQQVDQATTPQQATGALQQLAQYFVRAQRYDEAIATMQNAIAMAAPATNDFWLKQNLIGILRQADRTGQVESLYQEMLSGTRDGTDGNRFQVVVNYANYLSETKRAAESEALLKEYRASHTNLQPGQESGLLYSLANAARASGDSKRAEEYQQQAAAKQPNPMRDPGTEQFIGPDFAKAQSAASAGRLDEALALTLDMIDRAARAVDHEQVAWQASQVANALAQKKATGGARQIYDRLFSVAESWAVDAPQTLLTANVQYLYSLFSQRERWSEVPDVLERYRNLEIAAHGADTSQARSALQMALDFERRRNVPGAALRVAEDVVALEESLSGKTSEAYLNALRTLAETSDPAAALAIYLRRVAIADAGFSARDEIRGYSRTEAARALARNGQFDEAERILDEAITLAKNWTRQSVSNFTQEREQICRMRARQQEASARR